MRKNALLQVIAGYLCVREGDEKKPCGRLLINRLKEISDRKSGQTGNLVSKLAQQVVSQLVANFCAISDEKPTILFHFIRGELNTV